MNKLNKVYNIFLIFLIIIITCFPKINIITFENSRLGIRLDDIFVLLFFVIFIIKYINKGMKKYKRLFNIINIFVICFIFFFTSNVINILYNNVEFVKSMLYLFRKLEYFVLIFAGYDLLKNNNQDNKKIIKLFKYILIFHFIYMILEYFNIIPDIGFLIGRVGNDRIYSTFSGPYEFAGFLSIIFPLFLYGLFFEKKYQNIFYIIFMFIGIIISESRISLLAIIVSLLIFIIYRFVNKKNMINFISLSFISFICMFLIINYSNIKSFDRIKEIDFNSYVGTFQKAWNNTDYEYYKETGNIKYNKSVLNSTKDLSYALRVSKWTTILKEAKKSPLIGLGHSVAGEAMDGSLVRMFCESGLIGMFLWLYLLWTVYKVSRQHSNKCKLIVLNIIIILMITACFIDIFEASKVMMSFWLILGFLLFQKKQSDKTKIIHVVSGVNFGGVEAVIYNYFSNLKNKNKYDNIIVSHEKINHDNKKQFEKLKFRFYEVAPKKKNIIKNFIQLYKIIRKEKPDIVHVHMTLSSYMALLAAYLNSVDVRICHSHLALERLTITDKIYKKICNIFSNIKFACSKDAAIYMFNDDGSKKSNVYIINNAIVLDKFDYNKKIRNEIRKKLNIEEKCFLIGNIGRFTEQKNHIRIIELFEQLIKKDSFNKYKLILIGNGYLMSNIKKMVEEKKITKDVMFLESTTSISDYYQSMDLFLFPSLYEGLGIVAVEAQVSGLPCIVSNNVPFDVKVSDLVSFVDLSCTNDVWIDKIIESKKINRKTRLNEISKTNFNIKNEAKKLDDLYTKILNDV